ncbi:TetR/AcrR family transcriptional regulator [Pseudomonas sp. PDM31]|uniref:TetR/AcrR family transcriptional regulator n=1 Tax=Pseudomonas sp. PDM31 TaxID=2854778 RepID=UPI001C490C3D|nr:helix-turn-helix domain-containing protein [Pseudomonas sp. PDM31]MBV7477549.1 TetR/AcrR family transcriptional regulator [Pseudomonas sp. PDM31]
MPRSTSQPTAGKSKKFTAASTPVDTQDRQHPTKKLIINTAEQLFADYGIDAVSLRQIAADANQANNYAIQYHFGTKAELVSAILDVRFAQIETRRETLLSEQTAAGNLLSVRTLLSMLFVPRAEMLDAEGRNTFAKFMMEFRIRFKNFEGIAHPIERDARNQPATLQISEWLKESLPDLPQETYAFRTRYLSNMFDSILVERDTQIATGATVPTRERLLERALDMAVAALVAPPEH